MTVTGCIHTPIITIPGSMTLGITIPGIMIHGTTVHGIMIHSITDLRIITDLSIIPDPFA